MVSLHGIVELREHFVSEVPTFSKMGRKAFLKTWLMGWLKMVWYEPYNSIGSREIEECNLPPLFEN